MLRWLALAMKGGRERLRTEAKVRYCALLGILCCISCAGAGGRGAASRLQALRVSLRPSPGTTFTGHVSYTRMPRATCHVQVADALFRMDAPPWIRAHSEGLTGSASLNLEPAATAAAAAACAADPGCCSLAAIATATAAAGGADARALRRAHLQVGGTARH